MTLDVTIGKIEIFHEEDRGHEKDIAASVIVAECPVLDYDLCNPKYTAWPRKSWRSGNTMLFFGFFETYLPEIYNMFFDEECVESVFFLQPVIKEIKGLKMPKDPRQADRMLWLKFWCERAVDLYGQDAGIMFN